MSSQAVTKGLAATLIIAIAALLSGCDKPQDPQTNYSIVFNMRCSTCNDFLDCSAGEENLVFRIHELSFWQQIATIADYLTFAQKTQRSRPLTVYRVDGDGITVRRAGAIAEIDTVVGRIKADHFIIDQRDGALEVSGKRVGECRTLARREGFALVRELLGRPLPGEHG